MNGSARISEPKAGDTFPLFELPWEIRLQIYEYVITWAVNFNYKPPCMFEEAASEKDSWNAEAIPFNEAIEIAKIQECGVTYDISKNIVLVESEWDTMFKTSYLLTISKEFTIDIKTAATEIRAALKRRLNKFITGPKSWTKTISDERLTNEMTFALIAGRHIFHGFSYHTISSIIRMGPKICRNVRHVVFTSLRDPNLPFHCWTGADGVRVEAYPPYTYFARQYFWNVRIVGVMLKSRYLEPGNDEHDEMYVHGFCNLIQNEGLDAMELIYRDRNIFPLPTPGRIPKPKKNYHRRVVSAPYWGLLGPSFMSSPPEEEEGLKNHDFFECPEVIDQVPDISEGWTSTVMSMDEIDRRGRIKTNYGVGLDVCKEVVAEGQVVRLCRRPISL
ncbi:hypothetical protein TWF694_002130 [Orbilia ellipsospora]|uniref:Uncharacterized protein n=1 Tax=Orbilia ellipsospora TaxID=2528407 RepID=A0AAV9X4L3_9PEZI